MNGNEEPVVDRDEAAAGWCVRLAEGPLEVDEQTNFDAWVAEADNHTALKEAIAVWTGTETAMREPEGIAIRAEALEAFRYASRRRWARRAVRHWRVPMGIAALLIIAVITSLLFLSDPVETYETGIGERQVAVLDDGSSVSLDAATQVEVQLGDERREVRLLAGRAKFDVAPDPLRPFSVVAGDKIVVATGTAFSVELIGEELRVVVYEGAVDVLEQGAGAEAEPVSIDAQDGRAPARALRPGQQLVASIDPGEVDVAAISPADMQRSLSWEAGQLSFDNEPLAAAAERMNRYADTRLVIADAATGDLRVNGVFDAGDTAAFVEGMSVIHGLRTRREEGRVTLSRP
ncbi:MAG: FecR domain-containing protein [Pseudomonadota bacterium]